jgi:hypothetical protein
MPRAMLRERSSVVTSATPTRYLLVRQQADWLILFGGEAFGPYRNEREAQLFAVDAARRLAARGESTEVLRRDETGAEHVVWRHSAERRASSGVKTWMPALRRA